MPRILTNRRDAQHDVFAAMLHYCLFVQILTDIVQGTDIDIAHKDVLSLQIILFVRPTFIYRGNAIKDKDEKKH